MLTGIYKTWFILQLRISTAFCSVPFEWNNDTQRIRETQSKYRKITWFAFVIAQWVYTPFLIFRLIGEPMLKLSPKLSVDSQFQLLGWIAVFTGSSLYHIPMVFKRKSVMKLTNSMFGYEKEYHPNRNLIKTAEDRLDELILMGSCFCSVAMPISMTLFFWARPCSPQFVGSLFLTCNTTSPTILQVFPFLVFEILLLHPFAGTIFFCAWCLKYAQLKSLVKYLRPIGADEDNVRIPKMAMFEQKLQRYKYIQLLGTLYNDCFLITTQGIQAVACGATIAPMYVAIRMYGIIKMPGYIFFPMTSFQASLVIYFLFGAAGNVFSTSGSVAASLKQQFDLRRVFGTMPIKLTNKERLLVKTLESLSPIKIRSGGICFVDKNTMIHLLRFCVEQTMSLLLINRKSTGIN